MHWPRFYPARRPAESIRAPWDSIRAAPGAWATCFASAVKPVVEGAPVEVELGGARIEGVPPAYAERTGASTTRQGGALGGAALRRQPLVIDYPGRRILLGPPA